MASKIALDDAEFERFELRRAHRRAVNHLCWLAVSTLVLVLVTKSVMACLPAAPSVLMEVLDMRMRL